MQGNIVPSAGGVYLDLGYKVHFAAGVYSLSGLGVCKDEDNKFVVMFC